METIHIPKRKCFRLRSFIVPANVFSFGWLSRAVVFLPIAWMVACCVYLCVHNFHTYKHYRFLSYNSWLCAIDKFYVFQSCSVILFFFCYLVLLSLLDSYCSCYFQTQYFYFYPTTKFFFSFFADWMKYPIHLLVIVRLFITTDVY